MKRRLTFVAGSPYDSWRGFVLFLGLLAALLAVAQLVLFGFDLGGWLGAIIGFALAGLALRVVAIRKARRSNPG